MKDLLQQFSICFSGFWFTAELSTYNNMPVMCSEEVYVHQNVIWHCVCVCVWWCMHRSGFCWFHTSLWSFLSEPKNGLKSLKILLGKHEVIHEVLKGSVRSGLIHKSNLRWDQKMHWSLSVYILLTKHEKKGQFLRNGIASESTLQVSSCHDSQIKVSWVSPLYTSQHFLYLCWQLLFE